MQTVVRPLTHTEKMAIDAQVNNRTAKVKYVRSYIPGGLEWSLFLSGNGHWVRILPSIDATAKFRTKEAAIRCGAIWVHFGIQPSQQTDDHEAKLDEMIAQSRAFRKRFNEIEATYSLGEAA